MFKLIAIPFGWVMYLIYQAVHSYGISIILFTIIVKLVTMPSTYKMQVNQARIGLLSPKLERIKKAFPNNPQRQQEETTKIYSEEGVNPGSGCLGSLVTLLIVLGVYRVVMQPLTYILRFSGDTITKAKDLLLTWMNSSGIENAERTLNSRPELMLLRYAKTNPDIFSPIEGFADKLNAFKNTFLGFDLTGIPSLHPENGWTLTSLLLVLLPVLAALANLAMTIVTQVHNKRTNPSAQQMGGMMNLLLYASPIMTIWFGLSFPAGVTFYWLINSVVTLIVQVLLYRWLRGERLEQINQKEKAKVLAKGPSWMQRMMEQSQQMQAQQAGGARPDANRTRYSDGDDGMSRKERAEYERKLIEAARRRAAEKYGEELPPDSDFNED